MLYPAELRDRAVFMACCALVLKSTVAFAAHPCAWREAVETRGQDVVGRGGWRGPGAPRPSCRKGGFTLWSDRPTATGAGTVSCSRWGAAEPVQVRWLRQGIAFADVSDLKPACRDVLLAAEAEARAAKRGLWRGGGIEQANDPTLVHRRRPLRRRGRSDRFRRRPDPPALSQFRHLLASGLHRPDRQARPQAAPRASRPAAPRGGAHGSGPRPHVGCATAPS